MEAAATRKPGEKKSDIGTGARKKQTHDEKRNVQNTPNRAASPITPAPSSAGMERTTLPFATSSGLRAPGAKLLGIPATTIDELIETIAQGLPTATLGKLSDSLGFNRRRVLELTGISERSLVRRKLHARLTPAESERTARVARVTERAHQLMGTEAGNRWLTGQWPALNHKTPLQYAQSDLGAELVIDLMSALEDGIFV